MATAGSENWSIPGSHGQAILGVTQRPADTPTGVLVLCHGFKGYMDYGFFPRLADAAVQAGLVAVRFNFSHSGMTRNTDTFEKPELFERDTWSKQSADLITVMRDIVAPMGLPAVVFGHSRGGLTTLITAGRLPSPPAGVVTAAAVADAVRMDDSQRDMLRRIGRMPSPSGRTGQELYVGRVWLNEIEENPEAHDPVRAIAGLDMPVLLLHGEEDTTVPAGDMNRLAEAAPDHVQTAVVAGGNHGFNAPNPMPAGSKPSPQTAELFERVIGFAVACSEKA